MEKPKDVETIEIRVDRIAGLFDRLDPFPFGKRDLDTDVEDYIVGWARELPRGQPLHIVVHVREEATGMPSGPELASAFAHYFGERARIATRDLKELFRVGRRAFLIGLAVLGLCLGLAQVASSWLGPSTLGRFFQEGLIIIGWVANWRPIEIFLYDWLPIIRRRQLYQRLASARVTLRADRPDQSDASSSVETGKRASVSITSSSPT